jgi:hypothetical protein
MAFEISGKYKKMKIEGFIKYLERQTVNSIIKIGLYYLFKSMGNGQGVSTILLNLIKINRQMSDKSPHILNAASNLLGFCFVVLTTLKVLKLNYLTKIDELTAASIFLLMTSVISSFLAIRSQKAIWERIADISFIIAILCLFVTTLFVTFNIIQ